jgi:hypothetical protein
MVVRITRKPRIKQGRSQLLFLSSTAQENRKKKVPAQENRK